jgi:hypothetical protein
VTHEAFVIVLAVLTAMCGLALVMLLLRRRREERDAVVRERELEASQRAIEAQRRSEIERNGGKKRRKIDDYAKPISFEGKRPDEDDDVGKICPACGSRYRSHFRFCERDNSELAALN